MKSKNAILKLMAVFAVFFTLISCNCNKKSDCNEASNDNIENRTSVNETVVNPNDTGKKKIMFTFALLDQSSTYKYYVEFNDDTSKVYEISPMKVFSYNMPGNTNDSLRVRAFAKFNRTPQPANRFKVVYFCEYFDYSCSYCSNKTCPKTVILPKASTDPDGPGYTPVPIKP